MFKHIYSKDALTTYIRELISAEIFVIKIPAEAGILFGAVTMNRTRDKLITNQLLYQLSYDGVFCSVCLIISIY